MKTVIRRSTAFLLLLVVAGTAGSDGIVREFSGTSSMTTSDFEVRAPWILDWRVNGDFPAMLGLQVALINAKDGSHVGQVVKVTDRAADGVSLFQQSGRYRIRVDSTLARWNIKIQEISKDDAKLYTPK
ncbi:MAG: hypothetical protein RLN69_07495 [Woeseiaceae bacterium]